MQHSSLVNRPSILATLVCAGCAFGGAGCATLEEDEAISTAEASAAIVGSPPVEDATWTGLPLMNAGRAYHAATRLLNGKVLLVGGTLAPQSLHTSAQLLNPATLTWSQAAPALYHHFRATGTLLDDGRVLVAGDDGPAGALSAELYDPDADSWTSVPVPAAPRDQHAAVRLSDGRVLLAGGYWSGETMSDAYLFDPVTDTWSTTGPMNHGRHAFSLILLQDGRVLAAGGVTSSGNDLASAELFGPQTGTWTLTSSMAAPRAYHAGVLLQDGSVLVAGSKVQPASVEIFDPLTETWSSAAPLAAPRTAAAGLTLGSGEVLLTGGGGDGGNVIAQIYDPVMDRWTLIDSMYWGHSNHTMTLLPCDQVLIAGGGYGLVRSRYAEVLTSIGDTICARADGPTPR